MIEMTTAIQVMLVLLALQLSIIIPLLLWIRIKIKQQVGERRRLELLVHQALAAQAPGAMQPMMVIESGLIAHSSP